MVWACKMKHTLRSIISKTLKKIKIKKEDSILWNLLRGKEIGCNEAKPHP